MSESPVSLASAAGGAARGYFGKIFAECDLDHWIPRLGWPEWKEDKGEENRCDPDAFRRFEFRECKFTQRLTGVRFIKCTFTECDFRSCLIATAEFYKCTFHECRFEYAAMLSTKLKFNVFRRCNFTGAFILRCDLYRSFFEQGNVFQHAQLGWVSVTRADLSGAGELRRVSFLPYVRELRESSPNALAPDVPEPDDAATRLPEVKHMRDEVRQPFIQENKPQYEELLGLTKTSEEPLETLAALVFELVEVYRTLSAVWMATAAYDDAAWAYRESKKRTRASLRPRRRPGDAPKAEELAATHRVGEFRQDPRERLGAPWRSLTKTARVWWQSAARTLTWVGLLVAGPVCGFGTRMRGVFACLAGWVALFTLIFAVCDAVKAPAAAHVGKALASAHGKLTEASEAAGLLDCFRYSIGQLVTTPPQSLKLAGGGWEIVASVETLVGIGLLGLLGFVLANSLRFS